jgi:hypothetical protein
LYVQPNLLTTGEEKILPRKVFHMEERKFRMLRKGDDGPLFPYTDALAERPDMVEVIMTSKDVQEVTGNPVKEQPTPQLKFPEKPGPGWILNKSGRWKRKAVGVKRELTRNSEHGSI